MQEVDTDQLLEGQIHARPVNRQTTEDEGGSWSGSRKANRKKYVMSLAFFLLLLSIQWKANDADLDRSLFWIVWLLFHLCHEQTKQLPSKEANIYTQKSY